MLAPSLPINLQHLPVVSRLQVHGRAECPGWLDAAWADPETWIVALEGSAGFGKSTLLGHWLSSLVGRAMHEAINVLDWWFQPPDGRRVACLHDDALRLIEGSIDGLLRCGRIDHQPRGWIARAALRREVDEFARAEADLNRAERVSALGGMRLFLHDIGVERLHLRIARGEPVRVAEIDRLRDEMTATGYACRLDDLDRLRPRCA